MANWTFPLAGSPVPPTPAPPSSGNVQGPVGSGAIISGGLQSSETADLPEMSGELNAVVQAIRSYLRDYPELNRLIKGVEHSNRQIIHAIADTLDDFNTTPPFTKVGIKNFPSMSLFMRGCVCFLLESVGLLMTRNHLNFSDGGLQVGINDKTPYIQSWLSLMRNTYEDKKVKIKIAMNIEGAWGGGLQSEYSYVNNFYGAW